MLEWDIFGCIGDDLPLQLKWIFFFSRYKLHCSRNNRFLLITVMVFHLRKTYTPPKIKLYLMSPKMLRCSIGVWPNVALLNQLQTKAITSRSNYTAQGMSYFFHFTCFKDALWHLRSLAEEIVNYLASTMMPELHLCGGRFVKWPSHASSLMSLVVPIYMDHICMLWFTRPRPS